MFTYTSLILVSLLVAVIARVIYKSVSQSSASVYNTKLPGAELVHLETAPKNKAVEDEAADAQYPTDLKQRGTYAYLDDDQIAVDALKVAEDAFDVWPNDIAVESSPGHQATSHCSLFEAGTEAPVVAAKAQAKATDKASSKAYNVSGKVTTGNVSLDANGKPWGW